MGTVALRMPMEACRFDLAADGVTRCLPATMPMDRVPTQYFADAACTKVVYANPFFCSSPRYRRTEDASCPPRTHVFPLEPPTAIFERSGSSCVSSTQEVFGFVERPELPPATFVEGVAAKR
jgi:hypothetical protein